MMYLPDLFGEDLMDETMNLEDEFNELDRQFEKEFSKKNPLYGRHAKNIMKTDVREKDGYYEISVDLPGFKKDEINLSLDDGYLTIQTNKSLDKDSKDKDGHLVRKERYAGNIARSFYVGDNVEQKDVHAYFEDGVLNISVPKAESKKVTNSSTITIE